MIRKFLKRIFGIHSPSKEWVCIPYEEKDAGALARKYSVDKSTVQAVLNIEKWRNDSL